MAWVAITETMLTEALSSLELEAYRSSGLATGQADPVANTILRAVEEVRGYVAAGGNTLGADGTVPERLLDAALSIIRYRVLTRLPLDVSQDRRTARDDAYQLLRDVAARRFLIEQPVTADTEESAKPLPKISVRDTFLDRAKQEGI